MTWLPWIFCVCSHRSPFAAILVVRRSFSRLLRPTRMVMPVDEQNAIGFDGAVFVFFFWLFSRR